MIGYNVTQINQLMNNIKTAYDSCQNAMAAGWDPVVTTLQNEWVGEDEQDYEKKFAERLCDLNEGAGKVVNDLLTNIHNLGEEWHKFQLQNTLDGGTVGGAINLDTVSVTPQNPVVQMKNRSFSDSDNRGLTNGASSATSINTSIQSYVSDIQSKTQNLFTAIETSAAFMGESQGSAVKTYMEQIGQALGSVLSAVRDIYEKVASLAGTQYTTSEQQVAGEFSGSNAKEEIEGELGQMKWN